MFRCCERDPAEPGERAVLKAVQEGEDDGLGLLGSASAKLAVLLIASASCRRQRQLGPDRRRW